MVVVIVVELHYPKSTLSTRLGGKVSSIYMKGGTYWYQRYVTNPSTGKKTKRVFKSLETSNYEEGLLKKDLLDQKWDELEEKGSIYPKKPLSTVYDDYLELKRKEVSQRRRSPSTLINDQVMLGQFKEFILDEYGDIDIRKINKTHIIEFKDFRWSQPKVKSQTTISHNLRVVRSFFSYCVENDLIEINPFTRVRIPRPNKREDYPNTEDFLHIYDFFKNLVEKPPVQKPFTTYGKHRKKSHLEWFEDNRWFQELIWLVLNTGMRVGETTILKWNPDPDDIGFGHSYSYSHLTDHDTSINIHFKRGGRTIPIVHLQSMFRQIPRSYRRMVRGIEVLKRKKYVFENELSGNPHHTSTVSKLWRRLCRDKGWDDRWTVHSLRHGFTSYLLNSGKPIFVVSRILGHSTLEMMDVYGHTTRDDMVESFKSLPSTETF